MQIQPIITTKIQPVRTQAQKTILQQRQDIFVYENRNINKKPFMDRKIIKENQDINEFFNNVAQKIFPDSNACHSFSKLLQEGYISLSSNTYKNISNPKSAIAIKLDETKSSTQHCAQMEEYLINGMGIGINFSNFNNPIHSIKKINEYFKYRQPNLNRPPAGIALLDINHPKIMDFISLKDNIDYNDWCFDLSVIMDDKFLAKVDNNENLTLNDGTKIPAQTVYLKLIDSMKKSGEPGIIFSNDKNYLCDCCAASKLNENEGLTVAQINLSKFYNKGNNSLDYAFLSQSANILAMAIKRIDSNDFISILGYQDLLSQMNLQYGSKEALDVLEKCLSIIKEQAIINDAKMCISPSGTTSRILNTTPSIEPSKDCKATYWDEIETMATAQKFLDGGISKTILLKPHHSIQDVDLIIRASQEKKLKGITVFPIQ